LLHSIGHPGNAGASGYPVCDPPFWRDLGHR